MCAMVSCTTSWKPTARTVITHDNTICSNSPFELVKLWLKLKSQSLYPLKCRFSCTVDKQKSAPSRKFSKFRNQIPVHYFVTLFEGFFLLSVGSITRLEECWSFLRRHALLLSSCPNLCIQQALNEPFETSAHTWAQSLVGDGGVQVIEWLNNDHHIVQESRWAGCLLGA